MKVLVLGKNRFDFQGKDGGRIQGQKVLVAGPTTKKSGEGMEVLEANVSEELYPTITGPYPFSAEVEIFGKSLQAVKRLEKAN